MLPWVLAATLASPVGSPYTDYPRPIYFYPLDEAVAMSPWIFHGVVRSVDDATEYGPVGDRHGVMVTIEVTEALKGTLGAEIGVWMSYYNPETAVGARIIVFGGPKAMTFDSLELVHDRRGEPIYYEDVATLTWSDSYYAEFWFFGDFAEHLDEFTVNCLGDEVPGSIAPSDCGPEYFDSYVDRVRTLTPGRTP